MKGQQNYIDVIFITCHHSVLNSISNRNLSIKNLCKWKAGINFRKNVFLSKIFQKISSLEVMMTQSEVPLVGYA